MDDQPIYYDLGTITLPLSTDCTFEDHADTEQEPDGLVYEYEDVPTAIQASETPFNCYNTVITVRQEQVGADHPLLDSLMDQHIESRCRTEQDGRRRNR